MYHRLHPPSHAHTPSQEGILLLLARVSPRHRRVVCAVSTVRSMTLYCHLTSVGPCIATSLGTLNHRRSETPPPPSCLPGHTTHRRLICVMACVCHSTLYTSPDRGAWQSIFGVCRRARAMSARPTWSPAARINFPLTSTMHSARAVSSQRPSQTASVRVRSPLALWSGVQGRTRWAESL
jgi:hypothetical protein